MPTFEVLLSLKLRKIAELTHRPNTSTNLSFFKEKP